MTQVLQVPNLRTVKLIAEQSTGTERALLTDGDGHLQVDVVSGTVTPAGHTDDAAATATMSMVGGRYDVAPDDVDDGDAVTVQCDIKGRLITVDKNEATDDAAAPAAGVMVCGKFASMSPDANDATFLRVGSTGEVVVSELGKATDDAAAPTSGALVLGRYQAAEDTVDDGDAAPLRVNSAGRLIVVDGNVATDDDPAPTKGPIVMGKFGASSPDANDAAPLRCDATGKLLVAQDTAGAFAVDAGPYSYKHLAASGQVKNGPGFLHSIAFNTPATASTVTIYDNTGAAGDVIGIVTLAAGSTSAFSMIFDVTCPTGIYINATVPVDFTASYR